MNAATTWEGIFPAAMTMFDKRGQLDEKATLRHFDWLVQEGIQGIVITGTSGEFIALREGERRRVIELGIEAVKGRVPVMAGTGYYSTDQTIELTQFAERAGADGALVILPYYQLPKRQEVKNHYRTIAKNTDLPIFCYNNPMYSGAPELTPWDLAELYNEGVLRGVKSTSLTAVNQVHTICLLTDDNFRVFYGSFLAALEGLAGGAIGWISGILNIVPSQAVALWKAINKSKDIERARELWYSIVPLVNVYTQQLIGPYSDLSIYRSALNMMGLHGGYSRLPFEPLSEEQENKLRPYLEEANLIS